MVDQFQVVNTAKLNSITGNDKQTIRELYGKTENYKYQFTLFIFSNYHFILDRAPNTPDVRRPIVFPGDASFVQGTPVLPHERQARVFTDQEFKSLSYGFLGLILDHHQPVGIDDTLPMEMQQASIEIKRGLSPLCLFVDMNYTQDPTCSVTFEDVKRDMDAWFTERGGKPRVTDILTCLDVAFKGLPLKDSERLVPINLQVGYRGIIESVVGWSGWKRKEG